MPKTVAGPEDVEAAEREAEQAQEAFLALEHAALHEPPGSRPSAAKILAQQREAELAAGRVEVTRQRAEQARAARRLAALEAIGAEVDQLTAEHQEASAELAAAVAAVASGAATIRRLAAGYDEGIRELLARAAALEPERPDPQSGPQPSSARVALLPGNTAPHMPSPGIVHGHIGVREIGAGAERAVTLAAGGNAGGALEALCPVIDTSPPEPVALYRDTLGQFGPMPQYGPVPDRSLAAMISSGRAVRMTKDEIDAYTEAGGRA